MRRSIALIFSLVLSGGLSAACAAEPAEVRARMDHDVAAGKPLVAHVIVALADNQHQGIVPVPAALGDGMKPATNLYWGAMYGARTHFRRSGDWQAIPLPASQDSRVLDRAMFRRVVDRGGARGEGIVIAEAWRGDRIADAIRHFLELSRGQHAQPVTLGDRTFEAGGAAHVIVFVGHNGLMDFETPPFDRVSRSRAPRAAIVLACLSYDYFPPLLGEQTLPLLMTTGLMAPEAYTLEAALSSWFSGHTADSVRQSAAGAYARYQRIPERAALRLFRTASTTGP